ncbi:MAG: hypothetical protein R3181_01580 [Rubricoccaceae bacterium]|nr:hypothetical protein [Rubricoccaceae bacterium]
MEQQASTPRRLYTLAGVAGIMVGVFVLSFAFVATGAGIAFAPEVHEGGSIAYWIDNVVANPGLWKVAMFCITVGFGSMFVSGFAWFNILGPERWQKYVSLSGYVIGIPMAITTFMDYHALMQQIAVTQQGGVVPESLALQANLSVESWWLVSSLYGPSFVVVLGTGFLSWSLLKEERLPDWLCYWGMACGVMFILYLFHGYVPFLEVFSTGAGPLHMLWFAVMGIVTLRNRSAAVPTTMERGSVVASSRAT